MTLTIVQNTVIKSSGVEDGMAPVTHVLVDGNEHQSWISYNPTKVAAVHAVEGQGRTLPSQGLQNVVLGQQSNP